MALLGEILRAYSGKRGREEDEEGKKKKKKSKIREVKIEEDLADIFGKVLQTVSRAKLVV